MTTQFKAWITKYALTQGLYETPVEQCSQEGMIEDLHPDRKRFGGTYYHGEGTDWHRTKESALARCEELRTKKIASLKKQIAKLEKMDFGG